MAIKLTNEKPVKKEEVRAFSFDEINDRDKQIVELVLKELQLEDSLKTEQIKEKFQITPTIEVPFDKSIFYNVCKELDIFISYQGHVKEGNIKYPILSICADMRDLDKLVMAIVKKYEKPNK